MGCRLTKIPAKEMEMEMASTGRIDRILFHLNLLRQHGSYIVVRGEVKDAIKGMEFLKRFFMCARKLNRSNHMLYLESDNVVKMVSLPSFLSCIQDFLLKYEEDIHSLSRRSDTRYFIFTVREYKKQVRRFKQEIIQIYFALASSRSLQPNSCMTDDELVQFIDLILENLADLTTGLEEECTSSISATLIFQVRAIRKVCGSSVCAALIAQVRALGVKLKFLKRFIPFAKLRGTVDIPPLLLAHFEVVALNAARLSYMCCFYWGGAEEMQNPEFCSMIYEQQQKIRAIGFHVYEIYMEVLRATKSSKSLNSTMMNKQILTDFNDSLISYLWELLCYSSSFMDFMRDEMLMLYAGLRFLRSILREHQEKMDEQNEKIAALISEAGIITFSPSLNRVIEGEVGFLESTEALDFRDMLANTNIHLKHVKDQISGSSTIESPPNSSHSLRVQEVCKPSRHIPSKDKIPIANEVIVGLDDEAEKVIDRLVSGPEHVEIVPIVGMAGLGKTTLAKKVYNDNSIIRNFHIRLWCTVSQEFNMKSLLTQIFTDEKCSRMDDLDEHALLQKLYQKLKGNRYLVVFDDVWDVKAWNELRCSFPDEENRSRIIFTSRFSDVALQVQYGGEPHYLRPLNKKESFELLQKKVFGKEDCPEALRGFGMEIAEKCWGLPLAVVVVAGVLATIEHDILVWEEFAKCLTSTMLSGTDQCKKSLELSYEHLPSHLKACLLYFAAFQEDEVIDAEDLTRLWIAEGFVEKIEERRPEDVAEEYLRDLIGRNLVMVSKIRSIGGVKTCYIHDLILEFCKAKANANNFLQVLRGYDELSTFNGPPNLPRLSICSSGEDFIKSWLFYPHLGSLLLFGMAPRNCWLFNISFLFCYKHLKVLKLEGIYLQLKELPTEVELLLCLRYLSLTAFMVQSVPPSIAKLSHLETFCLRSGKMVSLPDSIWNMKKLRYLYIPDGCFIFPLSSNDNVAENHLSTLHNLDTLSYLYLSFDQGENLWRRIPNIRHLRISNGEIGNGVCNMSRLESLESLTLDVECCLGPRGHFELSFPMNLKVLRLCDLGLPWSEMSLIEQLPKLEVLKLGRDTFEGERWELLEGGFPELRVLTLSELDIVEWTEADPDSDDYFPCLQQLKLLSVRYLKTVPSCLERISTLETIEVRGCGNGVNYLVREIEKAQKNYGNENLKIIFEDY